MLRPRILPALLLCAATSAACPGCGSSPTSPASPNATTCTFTVTMTSFTATPVAGAVSAHTSAVQLSPAGGSARGQVELFIPPNPDAQRSTAVTIAGQAATVSQAGR